MRRGLVSLTCIASLSCANGAVTREPRAPREPREDTTARVDAPPLSRTEEATRTHDSDARDADDIRAPRSNAPLRDWASSTWSPRPATNATPGALSSLCEAPDEALERVARALAHEEAAGRPGDADDAARLLRAAGSPYVRPRITRVTGEAPLPVASLAARVASGRVAPRGERRCGAAIASAARGREVLVLVDADALADLASLPVRARTGSWLSLDARLLAPSVDAYVVLLGPRGSPRRAHTTIDRERGTVRARFVLDEPGPFTVQLVADAPEGGPRPVLEARVFADVEPTPVGEDAAAPGEVREAHDDETGGDDAGAIATMLAAARQAGDRRALTRDPRLDRIAARHAAAMRDRGVAAHEIGAGDLRARMFDDGGALDVDNVGENVARASSARKAHRALYASPSHRLNMLGDFTHVGVGAARDARGSLYVCQVFTRARR